MTRERMLEFFGIGPVAVLSELVVDHEEFPLFRRLADRIHRR